MEASLLQGSNRGVNCFGERRNPSVDVSLRNTATSYIAEDALLIE